MKISELKVGTKITDRKGYRFLVADQNNMFYEGTVLLSDNVISIRPLDEPKETYEEKERKKFGSNDYPETDLHRWLNSPDGFFKELSDELADHIEVAHVPYSGMKESVELFDAKVFIPSVAELGLDCDDHAEEGSRFPVFKEFRRRFALPTKTVVENRPKGFNVVVEEDPWCYWLRSSHTKHSSVQYICHSHSPYTFFAANRNYIGVRPVMCVGKELEIEKQGENYYIAANEGRDSDANA